NSTFHAAYHTLHEAADFMSQLATAFPDNFRVTNLGLSAEGREILGAVVSNRTDDPDQDRQKLTVVIVGTQHAREWIATSTALYLMEALLVDRSLRLLLNLYDFHIIPIPNPDGYVYTWEHDRFWYKNRQVLGRGIQCVGLDMNRDWGYKWKPEAKGGAQLDVDDKYDELSEHADIKASSKKTKTVKKSKKTKPPIDPCSHWYPGNRPFESPEVNNLANYVQAIQTEVVSFIDLRSFGQMVSSPYSYSCKRLPKDAEDQLEAALGAAKAIKSIHGAQYTTGTLCETLYRAPGNVLDWMYARQGIKYSYSVHLRDTGTYAFLIPPEWILPVGEEISAMISYIASFITKQRNLPL
ncbi:peptidase M14, carboxypeptidase A, partial [Fistulina hepatica ATCC 64428]